MLLESTFSLNLTRDQVLTFYRGQTQFVQVRDDRGRRLQFPLASLRPFVTADGVQGRFRIRFNERNKFVDLQRID